MRIDFCDADVLDVFDEWRRATGRDCGGAERPADGEASRGRRGPSLPAHMERVLQASDVGAGERAPSMPGSTSCSTASRRELESRPAACAGAKRQALVERLAALDRELLDAARAGLDEASRAALSREADEELVGLSLGHERRGVRARAEAAIDRLVRERRGLPTIAYY